MAEIKKLWVVRDVNITAEELFNDPAIKDDAQRVREFVGQHDMENILWQVQAMGAKSFVKDHAKFYVDEGDAMADAKARMAKLKKGLKTAARVVARFKAG